MKRNMKRSVGCLLIVLALAYSAAGGAERSFSVKKLPGCEDLPGRMASHYRPVKVEVVPAARQYKLPLDLAKLSNADFARKVYPYNDKALADKANALLKRNGFAVVGGGRQADVAAFYKGVKTRGVPIFVTSDSLLHLYHIQFDETLKDIEEREFAADALAISKAIQAEALKLHASTRGGMKEAARLLVGFATAPVVLLSQTGLGAEAAAALKEVNSWPARPTLRHATQLETRHAELMKALQTEFKPRFRGREDRKAAMIGLLERYLKAHPARQDRGKLIPKIVDKDVRAELGLIAAHRGLAESPLFGYKEDYSQYVPRGHYTRSKVLKQYFKAMMWYGRMTFLIRGNTVGARGLITLEEARKQTRAACMLAAMLENKLPDGRTLAQVWDRLYAVTAFYVGFADDLTPYQYRAALRGAVGESFRAPDLLDAKKLFGLRKALAMMPKPLIYSGLGDQAGPPADIADEKTLADALAMTQGLRLMGQRYIPDSFMMGKLVYPTVGRFAGRGNPFTLVQSRGGPIRGFPRGLDVMAVMGSKRARDWLKKLGDDTYVRYDETLADLKKQFGAVDQAGWNGNMYWAWLYTLQGLLGEVATGYPTFMQTDAWSDKQLSAALASWSQLRHDTILYAKQSYTMMVTGMPPRPKMVEGYVEPVPEFYGRLLALTQMTLRGLDDFKVLDDRARRRLKALEGIVERLLKISQQELANKKLTADDYAFIRAFGDRLKYAVAGVNKQGLETTIVADVHTDGNTRTCLEEGTGYLHMIVVVYPMPDGGLVAGIGPILSHYEFKHPMSDRLTDEKWKAMLRAGKTPQLPTWSRTFTVGPSPRPVRRPAPARRTVRPLRRR